MWQCGPPVGFLKTAFLMNHSRKKGPPQRTIWNKTNAQFFQRIKTYSYAMTPYVLMEHPEYSANEAITESRRLMDGKKWNLFCLTFSFIGWRLICSIQYIIPAVLLYTQGRLSGVTVLFLVGLMGPLNIGYLFLRPYEEAAFAAFYRDVRDEKREIEEIEMRDKWSENEPEESENA